MFYYDADGIPLSYDEEREGPAARSEPRGPVRRYRPLAIH
jgi:hypothetical protein